MPKHIRAFLAPLAAVVLTLGLSLTAAQPASAAVVELSQTATCKDVFGFTTTTKIWYQRDTNIGAVKLVGFEGQGSSITLTTSSQGSWQFTGGRRWNVTGTQFVPWFSWRADNGSCKVGPITTT